MSMILANILLLLMCGELLRHTECATGRIHQVSTANSVNHTSVSQILMSMGDALVKVERENAALMRENQKIQQEVLQMATDILHLKADKDKLQNQVNLLNKTTPSPGHGGSTGTLPHNCTCNVTGLETQLKQWQLVVAQEQLQINSWRNRTQTLDMDIQYFHQRLTNFANTLAALQTSGKGFFFTATTPRETFPMGDDAIVFNDVITNIGNAFDATSGVFTCMKPGVYQFTATVQKTRDQNEIGCHIMHNGKDLILVYGNDPSPLSNGGGTSTVYVHLSRGDQVAIGHCYGNCHIKETTSFSGALVHTD